MMWTYQKNNRFFAQIADGTEDMGADEIRAMGAQKVKTIHRGIHFSANRPTLYRVNYCSRLLSKVLAPLAEFRCSDSDELYRQSCRVDWTKLFDVDKTFAIIANVSDSGITHSKYAALRLKDAIVDCFRDAFDKRPSVDTDNPDLWLNLHIRRDHATISLETSGGALHRRGYRDAAVAAPMQETVAAAIIRMSGWEGETPLLDPMCGSGTLLSEALMDYCRIPAGYLRGSFGFQYLPDFDADLWNKVRRSANDRMRELPGGLISGCDKNPDAVAITRANLENLPYGNRVSIQCADFRELSPLSGYTLVSNPPCGIRIGSEEGMKTFYASIGDFLKQKCTGSTAFLYIGERELIKDLHLRTSFKKPLRNGGLDGRLVKLEMYSGGEKTERDGRDNKDSNA